LPLAELCLVKSRSCVKRIGAGFAQFSEAAPGVLSVLSSADAHLLVAAFGDEIAMRQDLARTIMGSHKELVETFVLALNRVFADAPSGDLAGFVERGLAEALNVSRARSGLACAWKWLSVSALQPWASSKTCRRVKPNSLTRFLKLESPGRAGGPLRTWQEPRSATGSSQ
jgi:hypothetical protein